jgi:polysaccharide biosynthesis/export protein
MSKGRCERTVLAAMLVFIAVAVDVRAVVAQTESAEEDASVPPVSDDHYVIGARDLLQVFVWRQADLSVTVRVRPDGKISTPLVEDIVAVGKTPSQLARAMEQVLARYLRSPKVSIIVQEFVGGAQIRVTGQGKGSKAVPYREGMTLLDVVIEIGGLSDFAAGNRSRVVRTVDGKREEIRVKLNDLVNRGKLEYNIPMRPGDVLVIPERVF